MGVIAFSQPQTGLDQLKNAADLINLIRAIATDPQIGKTVDDLSMRLSNAQQLSETKQQEAFEAEEKIAIARECQEDLSHAQAEHLAKVQSDKLDYDNRERFLQTRVEDFTSLKAETQKANEKVALEASDKLASAKKLMADADSKLVQYTKAQADLTSHLEMYQNKVAAFEAEKAKYALEQSSKLATIEAAAQKLAEKEAAFEAKKAKFDALMKE